MKMTRLFTTIFDPELKARGFKRKGRVYARLKGEILQGITIKPINPYSIHFVAFPYWIEHPDGPAWRYGFSYNKGYWAEGRGDWCIDAPSEAYYREENEERNYDFMSSFYELAKQYILPEMDKIDNLDAYLECFDKSWQIKGDNVKVRNNLTLEVKVEKLDKYLPGTNRSIDLFWPFASSGQQYAYLYKAYLDGSFDKYKALIENSELAVSEISRDFHYGKLIEQIEKNDLNWIINFKEEHRKIVLPMLREELGLDTFGL